MWSRLVEPFEETGLHCSDFWLRRRIRGLFGHVEVKSVGPDGIWVRWKQGGEVLHRGR